MSTATLRNTGGLLRNGIKAVKCAPKNTTGVPKRGPAMGAKSNIPKKVNGRANGRNRRTSLGGRAHELRDRRNRRQTFCPGDIGNGNGTGRNTNTAHRYMDVIDRLID